MSNLGRLVGSVVLPFAALPLAASMPAIAVAQETTTARGEVPVLGRKPFVDYFKPTPIIKPLSRNVWGAATVGPRDTGNGLEDVTMKRWNYWDGQILKGPDGKYRMFASR